MIRRLKPADAESLEKMLDRIGIFSEGEINVAKELVKIAAADPEQRDYNFFVYENGGMILGYHCTGRRPLTDGVFDLYWIVTDPDHEKKGIGKSLLMHSENFVQENKGRWLLIETSSRESYNTTRNFYLRNNYSIVSEIKDFYAVNDSLIVFGKYFNHKNN
jgi:aminoglycoside 6'-N-acetyltransferase I